MTTEEIKKKIYQILLYQENSYSKKTDDDFFVIPYVSMNDGSTPAQIRYENEGIYRDIQRCPFKRVSGVIGEDGKIPDIDITSLVRFGTLEQSKIAPTLENIDVKLYFREPELKKVKGLVKNKSLYADTYIWREAHPGFHLYNNDTLYGYEWLVLQDDYSSMDGVYNLQMNIEDGLGVCKLAGTQAPISLKGIQYKVIITAKNLWSREYSLLEQAFPIINSMNGDTDDFAPSVKAVRDYYAEAVDTKNATVSETLTIAGKTTIDKTGINTNSVTTKELDVNGRDVVGNLDELNEHAAWGVTNAQKVQGKDEFAGPHGIVNEGADGNLNAKMLAGLELGQGDNPVSQNLKWPAYIPFVDMNGKMEIGTQIKYNLKTAEEGTTGSEAIAAENLSFISVDSCLYLRDGFSVTKSGLAGLFKQIIVGSRSFGAYFDSEQGAYALIRLVSNAPEGVNLKLDKLTSKDIETDTINVGGNNLTGSVVYNLLNNSSISYKRPISEKLPFNIKIAAESSILIPNLEKDADGNPLSLLETKNLESENLLVSNDLKTIPTEEEILAKTAFDKLGSALQALHELPLATFVYKRGQEEYKQQLGILIERVNQVRDFITKARGKGSETADDNYLVHKRNSKVASLLVNTENRKEGEVTEITDPRVAQNFYTYTDEEIKSIAHYLDLTTSKKELQQELRNTVNILLKAAQETQDRLLDIETNIYGWDSDTLPGDKQAKKDFINSRIDKSLQSTLNNAPLLLGLNRLMRAICLEIFDTADLDKIEAETESRVTDSDKAGNNPTVKTRMDQIDEIMSVLYNQSSAMVKYYLENIINDEGGHTYVDMLDSSGVQIISEESQEEQKSSLASKIVSTHSLSKDSKDKGQTWKNLPSAEDVSKDNLAKVGFGQISEKAHKHSPKADEVGFVRIPSIVTDHDNVSEGDVEHTDYSKYLAEGKTTRTWQLFKVDKTKGSINDDYAAQGTFFPIYKTKAVAWDSCKLERLSIKVSELTMAVYGVDDVITAYPNRTEVLRRNITNLVDDLYPNRSFSVENKISNSDSTSELYRPFKPSNKTLAEKFATGTLVSKENVNTDEGGINTHRSIIPYFDEEIFNFRIENHFVGKLLRTGTIGEEYRFGKQIDISQTNKIIFDTTNLVTDFVPFNDKYGTYRNAFSRIDLLEGLLGIENCYIKDLFEDGILGTGSYTGKFYEIATGTVDVTDAQEAVANLDVQIEGKNYEINSQKEIISSLEKEQSDYESKIAEAAANISNYNTVIEEKNKQKETLSSNIAASVAEKNKLESENATLASNIDNKNSQIKTLETNLDSANKTFISETEKLAESKEELNEELSKDNYREFWSKQLENLVAMKSDLEAINADSTEIIAGSEVEDYVKDRSANYISNYVSGIKLSDIKSGSYVSKCSLSTAERTYVFAKNGVYEYKDPQVGAVGFYSAERDPLIIQEDPAVTNGVLFQIERTQSIEEKEILVDTGVSISPYKVVEVEEEQEPAGEGQETTTVKKEVTINKTSEEIQAEANAVDVAGVSNVPEEANGITPVVKVVFQEDEDVYEVFANFIIPAHDEVYYELYGRGTLTPNEVGGDTVYTYEGVDLYIFSDEIKDSTLKCTLNKSEDGSETERSYQTTVNRSGTIYSSYLDENNFENLETASITFQTLIDELEEKVSQVRELLSNLDTGKAVSELQAKVSDLEKAVEETQKRIDSLTEQKVTAENELRELNSQYTTNADKIATLASNIETYTESSITLDSEIQSLGNLLADTTTKKTNLESLLKEVKERLPIERQTLTTLNSELSSLETQRKAANDNLEAQRKKTAGTALPFYLSELKFTDYKSGVGIEGSLATSMKISTLVYAVLSRKEKKIQDRISTTESFLDSVARAINYGNNLEKTLSVQVSTGDENLAPKVRFEEIESWATLKRVMRSAEHKWSNHRIYDLDLSESYISSSGTSAEDHNKKVWQRVFLSRDVVKSNFVPNVNANTYIGSYRITGLFAADPELLPYGNPASAGQVTKGSDWTITVYYVKPGYDISTFASNTIYLVGKLPTEKYYSAFGSGVTKADPGYSEVLTGAKAFQNETEFNLYKTIKNIVTSFINGPVTSTESLYYQLMLKAFPVGSVYFTMDADKNPGTLFGGTWKKLPDSYLKVGTPTSSWKTEATVPLNGTQIVKTATHNHTLNLELTPYDLAATTVQQTISYNIGSHSHGYYDSDDVPGRREQYRTTEAAGGSGSLTIPAKSISFTKLEGKDVKSNTSESVEVTFVNNSHKFPYTIVTAWVRVGA